MDKLKKFLKKIKYTNYKFIKKIPEGMSNNVYLIEHNNIKKIVRIPKKSRKKYISNVNELRFLKASKDIFYIDKKGYLITKFTEGVSFNNIYPLNEKYLNYIILMLKEMHSTNELNDYKLDEINLYKELLSYHKKLFSFLEGSEKLLLNSFLEVVKHINKTYLRDNFTIIHGDVQLSNIIFNYKDNSAMLIDFEYVNYSSVYFDLGSLYLDTNFDISIITKLYFGASSKEHNLAVKGAALIYAIKWFYTAIMKSRDKNYQGKKNYLEVASYFFNKANSIYHEITNFND